MDRACEMLRILRDSSGSEPRFFLFVGLQGWAEDSKGKGLDGLSATQAWIQQSQDAGLVHSIKLDEERRQPTDLCLRRCGLVFLTL